MNTAVKVLILKGVNDIYHYEIPKEKDFSIGTHVIVSIGYSSCIGVIIGFAQQGMKKLKQINQKADIEFKLSEEIIKLIEWFYQYYQCSPYKAYQTIVGKRKLRSSKPIDLPLHDNIINKTLTSEQQSALDKIDLTKGFVNYLIHGVTGSGKTEIYIRLAKQVIEQHKQCILLVPEISLTPQFKKIFIQAFGNRLAVLHSNLTTKQKDEAWSRVYNQEVDIVLGPRSAIFAPFQNVGLVIIDECHDSAYKQDSNPRYCTKIVAKQRCKHLDCVLVCGSATPEIDHYHSIKPAHLVTLKHRINKKEIPPIEIIDLFKHSDHQTHLNISQPLINELKWCLDNKKKSLILVNRRGYASYIQCGKCKKIHSCSGCGLSFTYHTDKKFHCHRCQIQTPVTHTCKFCNSNRLQFLGIGTQSIASDIQKLFPQANIIRIDKDTSKNAKECENALELFKTKGDILVGTQMIAKGHDIEAITLVGILGIESTLNIPDFRCCEQTFQLLSQVAGRAGRGKWKGKVLLQTLQADHYAIQAAKNHDYQQFFNQELAFRQELFYPPFSKLIHIIISSKNQLLIGPYLQKLNIYYQQVSKKYPSDVQIIGPKKAPIEKIRGYVRWQIVIKTKKEFYTKIKEYIFNQPKNVSQVRVMLDFDAGQLV